MSIEKITFFWQQLAKDRSLRLQIQNAHSKTEYQHICAANNFNFTQEELNELVDFLSESNLTDNDIQDLSEMELGAVMGGQMQQIYGSTTLMRRGYQV